MTTPEQNQPKNPIQPHEPGFWDFHRSKATQPTNPTIGK
jgi:hypothetical protein